MTTMISRLLQDEQGATAIEYGLICALLAIAALAGLQSFAGSTITMWMKVSSETLDAKAENFK
ncbi:Flp family type IVb pilin [Croceicoccus marinus]|uniref:Flp family type IVb pilin n=1 Tax=Croceicoccus marinus TaxID=450378 RepID=A0A7G6VWP7_9SPHN|nr:Flp family type IVb pilin [Croceicoccus marinus]QNE06162.1 Flp family type IVb pilin [Croceicoccus marinus]